MRSIEEIRAMYPEGTKDLADSEVIYRVAQAIGMQPSQVAQDFGIKDPARAPRGAMGAINDAVINSANTVVGGLGAIADFVSPGNALSGGIDKFVESGRQNLSLRERLSQDRFSSALDSDDFGTQARGVLDRVLDAPGQTAVQAISNIAVPGTVIKGAQTGARVLGVGTRAADNAISAARGVGPITPQAGINIGTSAANRAIDRVGIGAASVTGGAMNAGDAAGTAYDLVLKATGDEGQATEAARIASIAPGLVGLLTGPLGAERLISRSGAGLRGGSSILKTAGIESGGEFLEEGTAAYSGRKVASFYDETINPMTGVFGQGLMGAVQGAGLGVSVALMGKFQGSDDGALRGAINNGSSIPTNPDAMPGGLTGGLSGGRSVQDMAREIAERQRTEDEARTIAEQNAKLAGANKQVNAQAAGQPLDPAQQAAQTAQQLYSQFGIRPILDQASKAPTGQFSMGNKIFFDEQSTVGFTQQIVAAGKDLTPAQQTLLGKLVDSGAIIINQDTAPKAIVAQASKFMDTTGIASSTSMDDVVNRIDSIIANTGPKTDMVSQKGMRMSSGAEMLTKLDALREKLTGQRSTRLGEIYDAQMMELQSKEQQKANKNGAPAASAPKTKTQPSGAQAPSAVTSVPVNQYLATQANNPGQAQTSGGPNGQQIESAPGMGEVSEQGSAGGTLPSADGNVGSAPVQPLGSGSNASGPNEQQNDAGRSARDEQRAIQPTTNGANVSGDAQTLGQEIESIDQNSGAPNGQQSQTKTNPGANRREKGEDESGVYSGVDQSRSGEGTQNKRVGKTRAKNSAGDRRVSAQGGAGKTTDRATDQAQTEYAQRVDRQSREAESLLGRVFEKVFVKFGGASGRPNAGKKAKFFTRFYLSSRDANDDSLSKVAQELDVPIGTIKSWNRELSIDTKTGETVFDGKYKERLTRAFTEVASEMEVSVSELRQIIAANVTVEKLTNEIINELDAQSIVNDVTDNDSSFAREAVAEIVALSNTSGSEVSQQAFVKDALAPNEDGDSDVSGVTISDSPNSTSVSERYNVGETISNKFETLDAAVKKAEKAEDAAALEKAREKLAAFLKVAPTLERKAARFRKENTGADKSSDASADAEANDEANGEVTEEDFEAELEREINTEVKSSRAKGKKASTSAAPATAAALPAPRAPDTPEMVAAAARWKEVKGDLTKLDRAELTAIAARAEKLRNTKLAADLVAELARRDGSGTKSKPTIKTSQEQYAALVVDVPEAPAFSELTRTQQENITDLAQREQLNLAAVNRIVGEPSSTKVKESRSAESSSKGGRVESAYKAADLRREVTKFIGADNAEKLVVYQSGADVPGYILRQYPQAASAQGFVYGNRAYLIADNIRAGRGKAVFMHEVGAHLGLDEILGEEFGSLVDQINAWAAQSNDSVESQVAQRAQARVRNAQSPVDQMESELVAYFIEEAILAGVEPSAKSKIGAALRKIIAKFKEALRLLGMNPQFLSTQDIVDLAYGAARLELSGMLDQSAADNGRASFKASLPQDLAPTQSRKIDKNMQRLPVRARPYFGAMAQATARGLNHLRFTGHILEQAAKTMPSAARYLKLVREQVAMRSTELHRVEKISEGFQKLGRGEKSAVNALIKDSTASTKWAFDPAWLAGNEKKVRVDQALNERFMSLSPQAQKSVQDVFAHGYVTLSRLKNAACEQVNTLYDEEIAAARKDGAIKEVADLESEKSTQLSDFQRLFDTNADKPYAPLRRYGRHVVTYRSEQMQDAMDVVEASRGGQEIPEDQLRLAQKFIRTHEGEPSHYQVYFRESAIEAERLGAKLKAENGARGLVQQFTRDEAAQQLYTSSDMHGLMYRLRKKADDLAENGMQRDSSARQLSRLMAQLHVSLLSEQNARHSENRRAEGTVAGAEDNMMRSFHQHGLASASLLAALHKSKDVQKALEGFERESKDRRNPNRETAESLYNEVAARHAVGLEGEDTPIADKLLRYNSAFMLLSRPVYYLQNAMQPWMVTLPVLMGRYGPRAGTELFKAYREVSGVLTANRLTADVIEKLPRDVGQLVADMLDSGRLNISLDQDMGDRLKGTNPVDNTITKLQGIAERVEAINRVTSAMAAYRLSRASGKAHEESVKYAGDLVYDTHGDYSGFNAPRIMRTQVGRIVTQFRKFQLIQIGLLAKLGREAFSKDMPPEERAIARQALAHTLGSTFMMGGMTALPGFAAIAWVVGKIFGEPDEPNDPEAQLARMRRSIGDPGLADFILDGASKALLGFEGEPIFGGWGNMMSVIPYTKVESADRSTYSNILMGVSGALVGGLGPKMFTGMGKIAEGDITGGLSQVLPTGVGNVVKAMEIADKGITRSKGAQILSPDDVSEFTVIMQALGLKSDEASDTQFINRVTTTYEAYYRDETQRIKQQYTEAFKLGNSRALSLARERWNEINVSRNRNGFDVQPFSSLIRAPMEAQKYEGRVNKQLNETGRQLAGMR